MVPEPDEPANLDATLDEDRPDEGARHVVIAMAVHNGARHLEEQLASLAGQDEANWSLIASDDGSRDNSAAILTAFAKARPAGQVSIVAGPCGGHAANFLSLIRNLPDRQAALAFADQDDVWHADRLSRGLAALASAPDDVPVLFCSRTWVVNDALCQRRLSPPRPRPPGFRNALVQNIAAGNTILLNATAARLAQRAAERTQTVIAHDWWLYQLISGAGGQIIHDDAPTLLYRQHAANQIGSNDSARARLTRLGMMWCGEFARRNTVNLAALDAVADELTDDARATLGAFERARAMPLFERLSSFRTIGLYRQGFAGTVALWLAIILGKI